MAWLFLAVGNFSCQHCPSSDSDEGFQSAGRLSLHQTNEGPQRILGVSARLTRVSGVLPTSSWNAMDPARPCRHHAWYSYRAGFIVISENPQELLTRSVGCSALCKSFWNSRLSLGMSSVSRRRYFANDMLSLAEYKDIFLSKLLDFSFGLSFHETCNSGLFYQV